MVLGGKRRWIQNPETLHCLGGWDAVKKVDDGALNSYSEGTPIPDLKSGSLLKGTGPKVYSVDQCARRWIPDPDTLNAMGFKWGNVQTVPDEDLNLLAEGA